MSELSHEFVSIAFQMDPQTDDLIRGDRLKNGMIVLIEDHIIRGNPQRPTTNDYDAVRLLVNNRWCRVTNLRHGSQDQGFVHFIGEYANGDKRARTFSVLYSWYVKKDTIPPQPYTENNAMVEMAQVVARHKSGIATAVPVASDLELAGLLLQLIDQTEK